MAQNVKVVVPEFIFYEERHDGMHGTQEASRVAYGVEGQVAHDVCTFIVFSYLIARRREECKQNFIFRMRSPQLFDKRPSLFKLAKGGGVEPYILGGRIHFFFQ